jgi:uncharacterized protein YndB with AHSA1/START domain
MPEIDGQLEQTAEGWQLRFTRRLNQPREQVWAALTEPEHLAAWFPTTIEGERAAGAPLRFAFDHVDIPAFEGRMLEYDPPARMAFEWGTDRLRFELEPDGDGTILTLLDLLDEHGKASRDAGGWHVCLDTLAAHLEGQDAAHPQESNAWEAVYPLYIERFGPEASTIGPPEEIRSGS